VSAPVRFVWLAAALVMLLIAGCSGDVGNQNVHAVYDPATGKLVRLDYDSDHNGKIDTRAYMDGTRVLRIEIDQNEDGRVDRWEYYGPDEKLQKIGLSRGDTGRPDEWVYLQDGVTSRIDISTRGNGTIDRWEYYEHGQLARVEMDGNDDGRVDQWETYKDGHVSTVAFDTAHRGKPDRRLVYGPDGNLAEVDTDPTGNGQWQKVRSDQ
jgi:hypothetical protein